MKSRAYFCSTWYDASFYQNIYSAHPSGCRVHWELPVRCYPVEALCVKELALELHKPMPQGCRAFITSDFCICVSGDSLSKFDAQAVVDIPSGWPRWQFLQDGLDVGDAVFHKEIVWVFGGIQHVREHFSNGGSKNRFELM